VPSHFLIADAHLSGQNIELPAARSHYLCKVMRKRTGDTFPCFNGRGQGFIARVSVADTRCAVVTLEQEREPETGDDVAPHIALALLKGQSLDRALQQATELGAASIRLMVAARCNVSLEAGRLAGKLTHWQKIVAGACEQSGRMTIPELVPPQATDALLKGATGLAPLILNPRADPLPRSLPRRDWLVCIGPEGGWDETELQSFRAAGAMEVSLARYTLRSETVPSVALALVQFATQSH
jgi:16S rRNA (uracil1498-N3)-methyltransferase